MNSWKGEKIQIARLGKEVCFIIQCNLKYFFCSKSQKELNFIKKQKNEQRISIGQQIIIR